jgi:hypothetical protein
MSKRGNAAAIREVFHRPPTSGEFQYRQTGNGIFLVDQGDTHLGTVQKFSGTVWWAYPANSAGQTQFTASSRHAAAEALRAHHAATSGARQ